MTASHLQLLVSLRRLLPEGLNMTELVFLSAVNQELSEMALSPDGLQRYGRPLNNQPLRQMTPTYMLLRYPLLGLTSKDQVATIRRGLVSKRLLQSDPEDPTFIGLSRDTRHRLWSSLANVQAATFLTVPQYALCAHDTLWQMSVTHVVLGTAAVRLLLARHYHAALRIEDLLYLTGLDLSKSQARWYVKDLLDLDVIRYLPRRESGDHLWVQPGAKASMLLVESRQAIQATVPVYLTQPDFDQS